MWLPVPPPLATNKRPVALWYVPYILCTLCAIRCSFGSLCWVNVHLPLREPLEISMYLGITYKKWCLFFPMPSFQENGFLYHCASMILSPLWNIGDSFRKREKPLSPKISHKLRPFWEIHIASIPMMHFSLRKKESVDTFMLLSIIYRHLPSKRAQQSMNFCRLSHSLVHNFCKKLLSQASSTSFFSFA